MRIQTAILVLSILVLSSCVPKKDLVNLQNRYDNLQSQNDLLGKKLKDCQDAKTELESKYSEAQSAFSDLQKEHQKLESDFQTQSDQLKNLEKSYEALEQNSSAILAENVERNRQLLKQLEDKEKALAEERLRLDELQKDLDERSFRINELENLIASKEAKLKALKENLMDALVDFEGRGLSVEQRDGKVYVSMENKLLFASGSWNVGAEGKKAIKELATVLAQNTDISVLIEGHTDDVPYNGNGPLKDNWDLSTKRATEVLKLLLKSSSLDPKNLTAAGRGEFAPVAANDTKAGKAKNRRIEVILEPNLDQINELIKNQ